MFHYLWSSFLYFVAQMVSTAVWLILSFCCFVQGMLGRTLSSVTTNNNTQPPSAWMLNWSWGFLYQCSCSNFSQCCEDLILFELLHLMRYTFVILQMATQQNSDFHMLGCKLSFTHLLLLLSIHLIDGGIKWGHYILICCMLSKNTSKCVVPTINLWLSTNNWWVNIIFKCWVNINEW